MLQKMSGDFYASVFLLLFSVGMFLATLNINTLSILTVGVGSDFVPMLVSIAIFGFSIALLMKSWIKDRRRNQEQESQVAAASEWSSGVKKFVSINAVYTTCLILLYVLLLPVLGFIISSSLYLVLQTILLTEKGKQNILLFIPFAFIGSITIYALFRFAFNLMLPVGLLG
ncbi:tripartite tricarboxylate transporter TctB family protein [Shouchella patagoniensis]|uniref:tripartite tricarboxylate transporter TctB family protein n=1 Tax=Shouchella patagoniensis TaxID=228576 RepID=UPI000994D566|nr:tripartite tricarboxylate transporter TctB family protein [Shouchella patagoniensis]